MFETVNKVDKPIVRLTKKKANELTSIRNERGNIPINPHRFKRNKLLIHGTIWVDSQRHSSE